MLFKKLREKGVDLIDVSNGGLVENVFTPFDYVYQTHFAQKIKNEAEIFTGAVGMITLSSQAEHILTKQQTDIFLLGRGGTWKSVLGITRPKRTKI